MPASMLGVCQEGRWCGGRWKEPGGARRRRDEPGGREDRVVCDDDRPLPGRNDVRDGEWRTHAGAGTLAPGHLVFAPLASTGGRRCRLPVMSRPAVRRVARTFPGGRRRPRDAADMRARHARQPAKGRQHHEHGHEWPHHVSSRVAHRHGRMMVERQAIAKSGEESEPCRVNPAARTQRSRRDADARRFAAGASSRYSSVPSCGVTERGVKASGVRRPAAACRSAAEKRRGAEGW